MSKQKQLDYWVEHKLSTRLVACPGCENKTLVRYDSLTEQIMCDCGCSFIGLEHVVVAAHAPTSPYASWECPKCKKEMLIPAGSCGLPVICECGQNFPLSSDAANRFYFEPLEPLAESILAQDEMAYENLLAPLRAAQRFHYDVTESPCGYRVYNPSNDKSYTVVLGSLADTCQCGIWFEGSTCIHIESVRLKFGMPSRAQKIVDQKRFAYAWLDRTRFPARIRIGWFGSVKKKVETIVRKYSPIGSADDLMQLADDFKSAGISFHVTPKVQATLADRNALPSDLDLARMVESKGRAILQGLIPALHGFQVEGAIFLAAAQRGVLLDEMGLGKTVQAIGAALVLKAFAGIKSCLLLVPKSVITHWQQEIKEFSGAESVLVVGAAATRAKLYLAPEFFKITTIETFRNDFPQVGEHQLLVIDEVHKLKNVRSKASRVVKEYTVPFAFGLSGTIIGKSIDDLYTVLEVLGCSNISSRLSFYANHLICNKFDQVIKNVDTDSFFAMSRPHVLRRKKADIDLTIPPIVNHEIELSLTKRQEKLAGPLLKEVDRLTKQLKERYEVNAYIRSRWIINRLVELANSTAMLEASSNESSKLRWLESFLESMSKSKKIVVFTRWTRSQDLITDVCSGLGIEWVTLSGKLSRSERTAAITKFRDDPATRVFVSTDAGGVGVNLQFANTIVNFEPSWNPSTDAQRIQRLHRIGQDSTVHAYFPITALDEEFTLKSHIRKHDAASGLELIRESNNRDVPLPSYGELRAVIEELQTRAGIQHISPGKTKM